MPQTSIDLPFADGRYTFRLGLAQIHEIQNRTGDGIGAVFARLVKGRFFQSTPQGEIAIGDPSQGEYKIEDILSVIRQGLLGGKKGTVDGQTVEVDSSRANELVENYVLADGYPLKDAWALAAAILSVAIEGYDPPGEAVPPEEAANGGETEAAGSTTRKRSRTAR